jgi:hypothetical protein
LNAAVSKTVVRLIGVPGVRISPPPFFACTRLLFELGPGFALLWPPARPTRSQSDARRVVLRRPSTHARGADAGITARIPAECVLVRKPIASQA